MGTEAAGEGGTAKEQQFDSALTAGCCAVEPLTSLPPLAAAGNMGGEEEAEAVRQAARLIYESCEGLVQLLLSLREQGGGGQGSLRQALAAAAESMEDPSWLVPPMLQRR